MEERDGDAPCGGFIVGVCSSRLLRREQPDFHTLSLFCAVSPVTVQETRS